jgi:hypothetical protein
MTKLRFRCHNAVLFNTFCRPTRLKGERCALRHWNQYRMSPWRFFRRHLGIFASIDAHCAAFAAEMRRNSGGIHCVGGQGAARPVAGCGPDRLGQRQRKFVDLKRDGERVSDQRLHEDEDREGEEDVFGIAAARVGKFLRLIQTKRMG